MPEKVPILLFTANEQESPGLPFCAFHDRGTS